MRKKVYSFTLEEIVAARLKHYSMGQGRSMSLILNKIVGDFLDSKDVTIPVKKVIPDEYVDTPEDIEAMKNFGKKGKATKEDLEFEQSIKDTMEGI